MNRVGWGRVGLTLSAEVRTNEVTAGMAFAADSAAVTRRQPWGKQKLATSLVKGISLARFVRGKRWSTAGSNAVPSRCRARAEAAELAVVTALVTVVEAAVEAEAEVAALHEVAAEEAASGSCVSDVAEETDELVPADELAPADELVPADALVPAEALVRADALAAASPSRVAPAAWRHASRVSRTPTSQ